MGHPFELLVFHRTMAQSQDCVAGSADGIIIDLETRGKHARQDGFDTEINAHRLEDIHALASLVSAPVLCRINLPQNGDWDELDAVLDAGADEIIVPMIADLRTARAMVDRIAGTAAITLMIETRNALSIATQLADLPVNRIYVGLNDLRISCGHPTIFTPMRDGSLDQIREGTRKVQFGFGGLTLPSGGSPLPARHLFGEMARLKSDFTFLRRSFYRDTAGKDVSVAIAEIRQGISTARARAQAQVAADFADMQSDVAALDQVAT